MPGSQEKVERNADVVRMRRDEKMTFTQIGYELNISYQRARFIYKRWQRRTSS